MIKNKLKQPRGNSMGDQQPIQLGAPYGKNVFFSSLLFLSDGGRIPCAFDL
jgi:hypothetical protein